jgi:hypothetical protein
VDVQLAKFFCFFTGFPLLLKKRNSGLVAFFFLNGLFAAPFVVMRPFPVSVQVCVQGAQFGDREGLTIQIVGLLLFSSLILLFLGSFGTGRVNFI